MSAEPPPDPDPEPLGTSLREAWDALVSFVIVILGAWAAGAQIWDYLQQPEKASALWGSLAVLAALLCLVMAWRRYRRSGRPEPPFAGPRWAAPVVYGATAVMALSVAAIGIAALRGPTSTAMPPTTTSPPTTTTTSPPPTTTTSPPPPPTTTTPLDAGQVSWRTPTDATPPVTPADNKIAVGGRVRGVAAGHQVWVLSHPFGDGDYFVVFGHSLRVGDGEFDTIDADAGSADDPPGSGHTYTLVDADPDCAAQLAEASRPGNEKAGPDQSRRLTAPLVVGCRPLEPTTRITFR